MDICKVKGVLLIEDSFIKLPYTTTRKYTIMRKYIYCNKQPLVFRLILGLFFLLAIEQQAMAQVTANCRSNYDAYLNFFGVDTVFAADLNNGSLNADIYLVDGQPYILYNCANLGLHSVQFVAIDTMTGASDTCFSTVHVLDLIAPQAICASNVYITLDSFGNGILTPTQLDPSGASYDACGIMSYTINGVGSLSLNCSDTGTQVMLLGLTDASGNSSNCTANVHIFDSGICSAGPLNPTIDTIIYSRCDTNSCTGAVLLSITGGWSPYQMLWSDGVTSTALMRTQLCPETYAVTVVDAVGTTFVLGPFDLETDPSCVWPGDTDNSHKANHFDLLPIALAYNQNGILRPNASTTWQGETSPDWSISSAIIDLPDWKHIDADGNAVIDSMDVNPILLNYNQNYFPVTQTILSPFGPIPLFADTVQVDEGQTVTIPINLGTSAVTADSVYALAFSIVYDSSLVEYGSVSVSYEGSWLGSDLVTIEKDFSNAGRLELALGRKDHQPMSGAGMIASVSFTIRDDIFRAPLSRTMPIRIEQVRMIDELNNLLPVTPIEGELIVNEVVAVTQHTQIIPDVLLFPNPTKNELNIVAKDTEIRRIVIFNTAGQKVLEEANPNMQVHTLSLSELSEGVYIVQLQTKDFVFHKRVLIRR